LQPIINPMTESGLLRIAAYSAFLASWLVFAICGAAQALQARRVAAAVPSNLTPAVLLGTLLQGLSALPITLAIPDGPLRAGAVQLAAVLALSPFGAVLFVWATRSAQCEVGARVLVTEGAYRWLRHPMYLAFLALLVATGVLASAGLRLAAAVALYIGGSELRIATEEAKLSHDFPAEYQRYRLRTPWRYLPGLR
jgi:protein-S-isoprenylcysteine O-methyltransferase Ste14